MTIRDTPDHEVEHTDDEVALAGVLADKKTGRDPLTEPRVMHDVECVTTIQSLRRGRTAQKLDDAIAVFVTRSPEVYRNTTTWWRGQGYSGIPPSVHQLWLANVLWLKVRGPVQAVGDHPTRSLVALCEAALRPDQGMWESFLERLGKLVEDKELTSDEAVAILSSSMADDALSRAMDDIGDDEQPDASCAQEAIDRVRREQVAEAQKKEALWQDERTRRIALEDQIAVFAARCGRAAAKGVFGLGLTLLVAIVVLGGGYFGASGIIQFLASVLLLILGIGNYGWGLNLKNHMIEPIERWIIARILKWWAAMR